MLDLIRETLWFDFGYVHSVSINYIFSFMGIISRTTPRISPRCGEKREGVSEESDKVVEAYFGE